MIDLDHFQAPLAGALGGVVRALMFKQPFMETLSTIAIGGICATYLWPLALPLIEKAFGSIVVDGSSRIGLSAFIIGAGGVSVITFIVEFWKGARSMKIGDRE